MRHGMNVGARLALGFAAVLVLMACIAGISLSRLADIKANLTEVTGQDAERLHLANALRDLARHQSVTLRDLVIQDDFHAKKAELAQIKQARDQYERTGKMLAEQVPDGPVRQALLAADAAHAALKSPIEQVVDRSMSEDLPGAGAALRDRVQPAQAALLSALDQVIQAAQQLSHQRGEVAEREYAQAVTLIIGLSVLSLGVGVAIAIGIRASITGPLHAAVGIAQSVAAGDLTRRIEVHSQDEVGQLLQALATVNANLGRMLTDVRQAAENMHGASSEIASGNADLSQRTEHQAASLQETAASMDALAEAVRANAGSAELATRLAGSASEVAERGGQVVREVVSTMTSITASSRRINDIIGVIDGIAFQTNILALNAAVEAARAGEQGRGFAVVAGEVRTLAQRSAQAAQEIRTLITESVGSIDAGSRQVEAAGHTMDDIVSQVQQVSALIGDIGGASARQTDGVEQIRSAVTRLDDVTQQNAALVEQSAAAAAKLSRQATKLVDVVQVFRLNPA